MHLRLSHDNRYNTILDPKRNDLMLGLVGRGEVQPDLESRNPDPIPVPLPWHGPVTDLGDTLNDSTAAAPFSHGLHGVDQSLNWTSVNALTSSLFLLMALTLMYRWTRAGHAHIRHLFAMGQLEDQRYWKHDHNHFWPRLKKQLIYAPLFRQRHNKEIQLSKAISIGTLPSRYHTLLLVLYFASNLAYLLVQQWDRKNSASIIAEIRGRAGALAAFNLIPTVLFALRNNPLIPILGVPYDTFNLLHRWCARIVVFEAVVHASCWTVNAMNSGGIRNISLVLSTSASYSCGLLAVCTFSCMALMSLSPIRHAFYETFLTVHRLLALVAFLGVYFHLDRANLPQLPFIRFVFILWSLEWVWRSLRIYYYNVSWTRGITKVTVQALPADACRVTFDLKRPWTWTPGCHVHAYLPAFALWSSHPFSVAWAEECDQDLPMEMGLDEKPYRNNRTWTVMPVDTKNADYVHLHRLNSSSSTSSKASSITLVADTNKSTSAMSPKHAFPASFETRPTSISLIMRARNGMTRQLYDAARASPNGTLTTWGALEGPYGGHDTLHSYGTVVLFAAGVGITHCLGTVYHLLRAHAACTVATRHILLVWTVPTPDALTWIRPWMDSILHLPNRRDVLRIKIFVSRSAGRLLDGGCTSSSGGIQLFSGRPDPATILDAEMLLRVGAMAVTVCGPGAFADSVRAAVREVVEEGSVDFVEEAFTF